ncbi:MAG TPA: hypothetical protein VLB73_04235 [Patescibacteria group bacterium]|nr:hypothetical protein [Patescibacteria group bacterium]
MLLIDAIQEVQEIGRAHGFTIVVVGGALVRFIGKKTSITAVDAKKKKIILKNAENPSIIRTEDGKTIVDIDCIAFSNEKDPFTKEVKQELTKLTRDIKKRQSQSDFPAVSLEPVLYHPYFPKPNLLTQFVSSIESYHDTDFFFRLGKVKQDVSSQSLAFWTYEVDTTHGSFTSLSPIAIQKRYAIRGFAVKPKDKEKIWGMSPFAQFVLGFEKKTKEESKDFAEWDLFAQHIQTAQQPSMIMKRSLWQLYWHTIGTYLAHGTGMLGKLLLPLGNTFFAGK